MTFNGALPADAFVWPRDRRLRRLPIGSMNGYANAHSLARLYHWALGAFGDVATVPGFCQASIRL
jgi:hypothetical protein